MKAHTRIYMDYFDYGEQSFVPCEVCGAKCIDVHHLNGRGKGKDIIKWLVGLCRYHHRCAHGLEKTLLHKDVLQKIHDDFIKINGKTL